MSDKINGVEFGELLRRAADYAAVVATPKGSPRWAGVMGVFGCGSTTSKEICRSFGINPDEVRGKK